MCSEWLKYTHRWCWCSTEGLRSYLWEPWSKDRNISTRRRSSSRWSICSSVACYTSIIISVLHKHWCYTAFQVLFYLNVSQICYNWVQKQAAANNLFILRTFQATFHSRKNLSAASEDSNTYLNRILKSSWYVNYIIQQETRYFLWVTVLKVQVQCSTV